MNTDNFNSNMFLSDYSINDNLDFGHIGFEYGKINTNGLELFKPKDDYVGIVPNGNLAFDIKPMEFPVFPFGDPIGQPIDTSFMTPPIVSVKTTLNLIKSQILDSDGFSVPYATVMVVGDENNYTTSDENGYFEIYTKQSDSIKIDMVGYDSLIVPVNNIGSQIIFKQGSEGELPGIELTTYLDKPKDNTLMYVGIVAGVLLVGGLLLSGGKNKEGLKGATVNVTI